MSTRFLADDLCLPVTWQAERYSTHIRLIGPKPIGALHPVTADIVLPYGEINIDDLRARCAEAVAKAGGAS